MYYNNTNNFTIFILLFYFHLFLRRNGINADRVKQAFYLKDNKYNQAVTKIKGAYRNKIALLNYLKSKLGKNTSVEISYEDLKKVAKINVGFGSYDMLYSTEARPKFSELSSNTINGAIYVINKENK